MDASGLYHRLLSGHKVLISHGGSMINVKVATALVIGFRHFIDRIKRKQ